MFFHIDARSFTLMKVALFGLLSGSYLNELLCLVFPSGIESDFNFNGRCLKQVTIPSNSTFLAMAKEVAIRTCVCKRLP